MANQQFIVAEVTKNWRGREYPDGMKFVGSVPGLISGEFEHVIAVNLERGYTLHSWKYSQVVTAVDEISETIIAVFQLKGTDLPPAPGA